LCRKLFRDNSRDERRKESAKKIKKEFLCGDRLLRKFPLDTPLRVAKGSRVRRGKEMEEMGGVVVPRGSSAVVNRVGEPGNSAGAAGMRSRRKGDVKEGKRPKIAEIVSFLLIGPALRTQEVPGGGGAAHSSDNRPKTANSREGKVAAFSTAKISSGSA